MDYIKQFVYELKQSIDQLTKDKEEYRQKFEKSKEYIHHLESIMDSLYRDIDKKNIEISKCKEEINIVTKQRDDARLNAEGYLIKMKIMEDELDKNIRTNKIKPTTVKVDYNNMINNIEKTQLEGIINKLKKQNAGLTADINNLKSTITEKDLRIKELIGKVDRPKEHTVSKEAFYKQCHDNMVNDYNKVLEMNKNLKNFADKIIDSYVELKQSVEQLMEIEK